ncbi:MAG: response regulator [Myxococcales bacterium]|nr:response regulator [Myxococcales bacterium]
MKTHKHDPTELSTAATHDIANALSTVLGWARLARTGEVPTQEAIEAIEAAASAAHRTARLALGDHTDEPAVSDLTAICRDLLRLLGPEARERDVRLSLDAPESAWVSARHTPTLRVAWNLVLNAIQAFEKGGSVVLTIEKGAQTTLLIEDDGPGMSEATQQRIFGAGYSERPNGHGIGLTAVRQLVADAGGLLSLDSTLGEGTRFRIALDNASEPFERKSSGFLPRAVVAQRILIVEDDDGVRDLLVTTLRLRGLAVDAARTAEEAMSLEQRYDVALVDLTLGDGSGLEVVRWLRERKSARTVVAMSGLPQMPQVDGESAPDRWLRKPFDSRQLFEALGLEALQEATG